MRYYPLVPASDEKKPEGLAEEYKTARRIGRISLGGTHFFFRSMHRVYYIPYTGIRRYFRRVMLVPAKLCCGRGEFQVEHLVICGESGELAQIELPGTKAAKIVMECMAGLAPDAAGQKPPDDDPGRDAQ